MYFYELQENLRILFFLRYTVHADVLVIFRSTVLSKVRGETIGDPEAWDPLFMPSSFLQGTYTSVCGHVMHSDCWQRSDTGILE